MTVTRKLLIPSMVLFAVLLTTLLILAFASTSSNLQAQETEKLTQLQQGLSNTFESQKHLVLSLATQVAENPEVQAAFAARDRQRLIDLLLPSYQELAKQYGISQAHFHLPSAQSFLRLHQLDKFGDDLSGYRFLVVAANQEQLPLAGLEVGHGGFGMRGVVPVSYAGQHIGTFEFGVDPGKADFESLKQQYGVDWQILLTKEAAEIATFQPITGTAQPPYPDLLLQFGTLEQPIFADASSYQQALNGQTTIYHAVTGGSQYAILSSPLRDYSNKVIGIANIILDRTAAIQTATGQIVAAALALVALMAIGAALLAYLTTRTTRPISELTKVAQAVEAGDLNQTVPVHNQDEIGILATTFNQMTVRLRDLIGSLEARVEARTAQLRTSAAVGRAAASVLEPDDLLRSVVNLITDRFGFYYAAAFILDSDGRYAVLREATGEAGRLLKERHHQLEVHGQSMVGYAITRRRPRIALDVAEETVRYANPLLPDTRSEIALPLMVGDRVYGALDVQSTEVAAFDETSANALQSMADQIAVALSNAEQFKQTDAALQRARTLYMASQTLNAANKPTDVLAALLIYLAPEVTGGGILQFGPRQKDGELSYVEFAAVWMHPELSTNSQPFSTGVRLAPRHMPLVNIVPSDRPLVIPDGNDPALDPSLADVMQRFSAQALAAMPLVIGQQLVGIAVVGYRMPRQFDADQLQFMQAMADQAATVLQNLRSAADAQAALAQLDEVNRRLTSEAWSTHLRRHTVEGVRWIGTTDRAPGADLPEVNEALHNGQIATRLLEDCQQLGVAVPIKLRDVPVGVLRLVVPKRAWNTEMAAALDSIAGHIAQASENARLISVTEERLAREHVLAEATEKVRRRSEIEAILQTAATELARYLNASHIAVRLSPGVSDTTGFATEDS